MLALPGMQLHHRVDWLSQSRPKRIVEGKEEEVDRQDRVIDGDDGDHGDRGDRGVLAEGSHMVDRQAVEEVALDMEGNTEVMLAPFLP